MAILALGLADAASAEEAAGGGPETYVVTPADIVDLDGLADALEADGIAVSARLVEVGRLVVTTESPIGELVGRPDVAAARRSVGLRASLSESGPVVEADLAAVDGFTGAGAAVVVVDSGVDTTHPALVGTVVHEACFLQGTGGRCPGSGATSSVGPGSASPCVFSATTCAHGTHVAGIVASRDDARPGIARGASIVAIRVVAEDGSIETAGVLAALDHVASLGSELGIVAVNLSFGSNPDTCHDPDLSAAVAVLADLGITVVAASGNGPDTAIAYPACLPGVVAVGSAEPDGTDRVVSSFTQFEGELAFVAPGRSIESTVTAAQDPGGWGRYTGTSMSAPHLAAALAVVSEAHPAFTPDRLLDLLASTGSPVPLRVGDDVVARYPEPRLDAATEFAPFTDASPSYAQAAVDWAKVTGVSEGLGGGVFGPERWTTRAEVATLLWRMFGSPEATDAAPFDDVPADSFYAEAVAWMFATGITTGTSPSTFSPDSLINRAQIATLLWRAVGSPAGPSSGFDDVAADTYFAEAVGWMVRWDITTGTSHSMFSPFAITTRANAVTFLWRLATTRDAWATDAPVWVLS